MTEIHNRRGPCGQCQGEKSRNIGNGDLCVAHNTEYLHSIFMIGLQEQ